MTQLPFEVNLFDGPSYCCLTCAAFCHRNRFSKELLGIACSLILHLGGEAVVALKVHVENVRDWSLAFSALVVTDDGIG